MHKNLEECGVYVLLNMLHISTLSLVLQCTVSIFCDPTYHKYAQRLGLGEMLIMKHVVMLKTKRPS